MKREIFFYGHFGNGHCLGRHVRPDDLSKVNAKKQEPFGSCFFIGKG